MRAPTPQNVVISLASPAADELGRAGVPGAVDNHWWSRFGAAILFSVIGAGPEIASSALQNGNGNNYFQFLSPQQQLANTVLQAQIGRVGEAPSPPGRPGALNYGYAMTVDTAQGSTATEHIHALPAGSHAIHGFKAYTAASRHERTTWIVVDEASERRHLASRSMIGQRPEIGEPDVWREIGEYLSRQPQKASALDMMSLTAETPRQAQRRSVRQGAVRA